ncbi:restriction endonuclease subunit S [Microbacterium pumilum]|uniref:Type I restriction modification DNA specificity domain-containing protein n=1 Tax=Microbacterium pumilum TaxID=344165 RepID=A0ABN2SAF0_9MICO
MTTVELAEIARPASGGRAGDRTDLPVYSVTKHAGFVPSLEYFKKQVFSRNVADYKVVQAGDFAYATIHLDEGSIGVAPEAALISPMYTVFGVDDTRVDRDYLVRFLKSPRALAHYPRLGKGAIHRRKAISLEALGTLSIPLPPLEEQRRIAAILDHADIIRSQRRAILAHLDSLIESLFHSMFDGVRATKSVSDIAAKMRTGPFGSDLLHSEFVDEGIAVLGLDNVVGNEFRWAERRYISREKYEKLSRYTVCPGDVLVSIMGTTGRCIVVPDDIPTAINTKHICAITVDREQTEPGFLRASFLWHPASRAHLRQQTNGAIMDGLNMGVIKAMPIPLPPLTQQREFVARAALIDAQRVAIQRALAADGELFISLQSRAFAGRL